MALDCRQIWLKIALQGIRFCQSTFRLSKRETRTAGPRQPRLPGCSGRERGRRDHWLVLPDPANRGFRDGPPPGGKSFATDTAEFALSRA
jgi:hypothetical protein